MSSALSCRHQTGPEDRAGTADGVSSPIRSTIKSTDCSSSHLPEGPLTPSVLVQFGHEARFSCPQHVVAGEVHGSVQVADGQAEPQHTVRQVDGLFGSLQSFHRVSQTQHCGSEHTHGSHQTPSLRNTHTCFTYTFL